MNKTICELFAGVGGFRLGFERQSKDWTTVWFSQWEPGKTKQWAHDCYVKHWGDIDANTGIDISAVDKKDIPKHTLLVGGFPCQDYSVARSLSGENGIEGKKGVLWWQIRDILRLHRTPFVLLENVDRLLKSPAKQRGRDFGVILACLNALGYAVEWRVINAAEYGAAQRRRRTFIFACHESTDYYAQLNTAPDSDIVTTNGFFANVFPLASFDKISSTMLDYRDIPNVSLRFKFDFANAGYALNGKVTTCKVHPKAEQPIPLSAIIERNVDDSYCLAGERLEKFTYLKGAKKIERTSGNGHKYLYSEGPIAFPDNLDLPARTMLTSEATVNRSTHVIEDPDTHKLRLLTPLEAERIQGFDDNWTATGMPEKMRYFCMGNALVVPMITRMAKKLHSILGNEK